MEPPWPRRALVGAIQLVRVFLIDEDLACRLVALFRTEFGLMAG
jgi:hypothetical protein